MLLALLVGFWFGHEPALVWGARKALGYFGPKLGLELEAGTIRLHLFRPIELRDVRFRVTNPPSSRTNAVAKRITLSPGTVWEILFGDGRVFRGLEVEELDGTFDFRRTSLIPQPLPSLTREQQEQVAALTLRFLPKRLRLLSSNAVFLADGQSYTLSGVNADFDEGASRRLQIKSALIEAGSIHQEILDGSAETAWKHGAMYLSGLHVRKDIVLHDFVANLVNIGGVSLDWDLRAYGGGVRGNVIFGEEDHEVRLDATVAVSNLPVKPVPGLIALPVHADGIIRDARITFRGNPDHPIDNEISLRLSAENFRWNERGWQSLTANVNYIGRRLYVTGFDLTQADNRISAGGELAVTPQLKDLPRSHYVLNISADVRDLRTLAALAGPPFDQLGGRFYVQGSIQGDNGQMSGYINGEASGIAYESLPPASARISIIAKNQELQVPYAEVWAGDDRMEANGSLDVRSPHRYKGSIRASILDLGIYTPFAGEAVAQNVFTGAATINWQGDGTVEAHSGAFNVRLDNVMTSVTPNGLTGEFGGTYSPGNVYFKTVRLTHGALELKSQLSISSGGVKIAGLTLKRGDLGLLGGEASVPLDLFALASGKTFAQALAADKPVSAAFTSGDLPIADLIRMAGQEATLHGKVRLNLGASGTVSKLNLSGRFTARDLTATVDKFTLPQTNADIALATTDGKLALSGSAQTRGFQPLTLDAGMPFAYEETKDGGVRLFHEDAPIHAKVDFPRTSLEILRIRFPTARRLEGTLSGNLNVDGKLNAPRIVGEIGLTGGDIEMDTNSPRVNALNGRITMDTEHVTIQSLRGEVGAGPFEVTGGADIKDPKNPSLDVHLTGTKVLLARDPGLRLRANLDIRAQGRGESGSVTGSVQLVDGRIFKKLEVTPLIVQSPVNGPIFVAPVLAGLVPPPWAAWKLDVAIRNGTPFLLMGNLATGEISSELTLRGTLGAPFLDGAVMLKNLQAYLPASTLLIPEGRIYFNEQNPFMPLMDVRARSEVSGYNVQLYAYGPLDQSNLSLRSDPPLSQENLIFLLTTGLTPAGLSGSGLGEAAAGQGGIILLRSIARQFEPMGIDLNDFVNRLSVRVVPPKDTSQASSLMSEMRLTDSFSLTTGRDGYGFYNAGVQYTIKLR
ncbi:MAG: translocation/assembly module TamB domain-containing protein [Chthoniobacterales bacterium]